MSAALLIDFGSTYTKLRALDLPARRLIGTGQGPSTVASDVMIGMRAALADLERRAGALPRFRYRLASSSAAGGLRMVTVGLVRELTAEAARQAALGAGAKLVGTFAYRLTAADLDAIAALAPDILLLAGGTDGGNLEVVLHNAAALGASRLACPIVYAGNRAAADQARRSLAGKAAQFTENVMPEFNTLNIEPAREAIRRIFIERIVHAKGIDRAAAQFDQLLMPTPAAVLEGVRLLADGLPGTPGLGTVLTLDPGGATTDVHSVAGNEPAPGVLPQGLPEPRVSVLELAVAEMASNAFRHSYRGREGGDLHLRLDWDEAGLRIALTDRGLPFDPQRVPAPAEPDPCEPSTWPEGGMGLALIRSAGCGPPSRKPCTSSQPSARSSSSCPSVSTPSPTTSMPRLCPRVMMERTIAASLSSVAMWVTNARSTLSSSNSRR